MKDIDIKCDEGSFKLRVSTIIIKDNKILLTHSINNEGYHLPGDHVKIGESTKEAIIREAKEEIKIDAKINNLYGILELIYKNMKTQKVYHEINYLYNIDASLFKDFNEFEIIEFDEGIKKVHKYKWFDLNDMDKISFKPYVLIEYLKKHSNSKDNIIFSKEEE